MTFREFGGRFTPLLLTFITPHLVLQTDLVMLSWLGETATAAYIVPIRIALLDTILTLALGSVASAVVAEARGRSDAGRAVFGVLSVAFVTGLLTAVVGVFTYRDLIGWLGADRAVVELADQAVIWYAATALFRQVSGVAMMVLHALGKGAMALNWRLSEVAFNALLNNLFIFELDYGFAGAFQATLAVNVLACFWSVTFLLVRFRGGVRLPDGGWLRAFLGRCGWEIKRMSSAQLFALAGMTLFATGVVAPPDLSRLAAYSAGGALATMLFVPFLALLRFLAIQLAGSTISEGVLAVRTLVRVGIVLTLLASLAIYLTGEWVGRTLYGLSGTWWSALILFLALSLPVRFLNAVQRGLLHADQRFASVALVDSAATWCMGLPLIVGGIALRDPKLAFSYLLVPEMCALLLFRLRIHPLLLSKTRSGAAVPQR